MPEHSGINDMEQEIERLKDALKMASSVCHEMKQPLMAMSGYMELLLMEVSNNPKATEKINKTNSQFQRFSELTNKLMNLTRC